MASVLGHRLDGNRITPERVEDAQSVTGERHLRPQQPESRQPGNPGT
jgi:hypothetical protein